MSSASASEQIIDVQVTQAVSEFQQTELSREIAKIHDIILVQDDPGCVAAKNAVREAKAKRKAAWEWFSPMCDMANKLHKMTTAKRAEVVKPVDDYISQQLAEIGRYESVRPALAMPWEDADAPKVEGLQERKGAAQVRVTDLRAVLSAALANEQIYGWLAQPLAEAVSIGLKDKAKELDDELSKIVPGIEIYREKVYAQAPAKATETITINRVEVESSQIASVGYKDGILEVQFKKAGKPGDVWNYREVPASVFAELLTSDSKGKWFNANVKGKYEGKKVAA